MGYTIIDAPGHRDFIKNMITGASQADCSLIMVPADGNFTTAIARGNHKAGEIQGQTRQHARLINLLGVKQICIGVNKMGCDVAGYKQARYDEIANEMKSTLIKVGWKKDSIEKNTPVMPISGWMGDNLLKKSENMTWWNGMDANPGDNVGLNIKGLVKENMPRSGDVMVYKKDTTLGQTRSFDAQIQVLDIPNEIKCGYSPIAFVRCGHSACRITKLGWKMGKETGGKKMEDPHSLKSNEMAECTFEPQQPLVCDTFKNCEGLSRVAFMDGNGVVMLGKVTTATQAQPSDKAGGKKK